jgi:hypothetical protein
MEWSVLEKFELVLEVSDEKSCLNLKPVLTSTKCPHLVQQLMSSESTPILSGAIPAFETFMTQWERIREHHVETRHWVDVGLSWAATYYSRMDLTQAYVVAMRELVYL